MHNENSKLLLLALWFGEMPFRSPAGLGYLISLLKSVAAEQNVEDKDRPHHDSQDSFLRLYQEIVQTAAILSTPHNASDGVFQANRVVLCMASTRRVRYSVHLQLDQLKALEQGKHAGCPYIPSAIYFNSYQGSVK